MWMDTGKRLGAAKSLLIARNTEMEAIWKLPVMKPYFENVSVSEIISALSMSMSNVTSAGTSPKGCRGGDLHKPIDQFAQKVMAANDEQVLLGLEGSRVKNLYRQFRLAHNIHFERDSSDHQGVNGKLTMGNYMAYGLAASALYTLGISFAFPLLHGKTRRGGLVFDVADVLKDAIIVPMAFALRDKSDSEFRQAVKTMLMDTEGLKRLIDIVSGLSSCS